MSYILNSDGKSQVLDASYIIVPQNDSLFAIVKNNNVTDLKELTIEEFLNSEIKEKDCILMYSASEKKLKAVSIPGNNAEYLIKRYDSEVTLATNLGGASVNNIPLMFLYSTDEYKLINNAEFNFEIIPGKYLIHTTINVYNEDITFLDSFSEILPLHYYLRLEAINDNQNTVIFDVPLLNNTDPLMCFHQSKLVEINENSEIKLISNYNKLAFLPGLDSVIIVLQKIN